jgi:D-tyrosyl-tRNA(Tyr) deacylase
MRWVIQRVKAAKVVVNNQVVGEIEEGLMVLCGIENNDTQEDADWLIQKTIQMRIFSDEAGKMNRSVSDIAGGILLISQFTLHALTAKGNRPSFIRAADHNKAYQLYKYALQQLAVKFSGKVEAGIFGADMSISCELDGPVTILVDSKNRE